MQDGRLSEVRVRGLRVLADITLRLPEKHPLVLIGDNGSGKSSVVEALELLRRLAEPNFADELVARHGGAALLRHGESELALGLSVAGDEPLRYEVVIAFDVGGGVRIRSEGLDGLAPGKGSAPGGLFGRTPGGVVVFHDAGGAQTSVQLDARQPAISAFGALPPVPAMSRLLRVLRGIEVHTGFDTSPSWAASTPSSLRRSVTLEPATRVERSAQNLASVYHALKNADSREWESTMDLVRLGLGRDVDSVNTRVDPAGGAVALQIKLRGRDAQIPAFSLSDGMLAYLAFVAIRRLPTASSLVAFDEPETHLHPELLARVVGFFEAMSEERPVVIATHSDRLLDLLTDPASSVAQLELDGEQRTRVVRPDAAALASWLERYRGLGDLRAGGDAASVMTAQEPEEPAA